MTDTTQAPAAPAAPTAPPPGETPINPNPVSIPQPVGSQAPNAPVGDVEGQHHPQSKREAARDAIKRAFDKATEPAGTDKGKAKPQQKAPSSQAEREPLNLRKRPDDQEPRPRAEHGHFAAKAVQDAPQPQAGPELSPGAKGQPASIKAVVLPEGVPYREAPKRWDERARAEWGAAPESVRASVHRMHKEFSDAYQRFKPDLETMNSIRRYHQMAVQQGTTLKQALDNYVPMEHKLRTNPIGGLDVIVNNLNLRTPQGQRIGLRDIAWHIVNSTPEQQQSLELQNTQASIRHQLGQLHQQQRALAQSQQKLQYERAFAQTRGGVDRFADAHPRLDELGDIIVKELRLGFDLPTAYRRAELLKPATRAAQTRTATAQTRISDRSIHGAPDGSSGQTRKKSAGRRDTIATAIKRAHGSL
jgi:hypothetical protein